MYTVIFVKTQIWIFYLKTMMACKPIRNDELPKKNEKNVFFNTYNSCAVKINTKFCII